MSKSMAQNKRHARRSQNKSYITRTNARRGSHRNMPSSAFVTFPGGAMAKDEASKQTFSKLVVAEKMTRLVNQEWASRIVSLPAGRCRRMRQATCPLTSWGLQTKCPACPIRSDSAELPTAGLLGRADWRVLVGNARKQTLSALIN